MKYFLLFCLFLTSSAWSQKETTQTFQAEGIKSVLLNSDEIYRISVRTSPGNVIMIKSKTEGEYFNNISLDAQVKKNVLEVNSRFREILQSGFDKLSAHKVFSMELEVQIPEGMEIEIRSNVASVFMQGIYDEVLIQLKSGSVYLENFRGNAVVNTYNGNIEVEAENASVQAESRQGKVIIPNSYHGDYGLKLKSINGNIKVREPK